MSATWVSRLMSRLISAARSARPIMVGAYTRCPRAFIRPTTRCRRQPPCRAPCTKTKLLMPLLLRWNRRPLQRAAVPAREVGGGLVGGLQEGERRGVRSGRPAYRIVGQQEFAELVGERRIGRLNLLVLEPGR